MFPPQWTNHSIYKRCDIKNLEYKVILRGEMEKNGGRYALYKASIKQNVLIRLVSSIRYVRVQDLGKMKCTAVRKRDERQGNEYKRKAAARGKRDGWMVYDCHAHQKLKFTGRRGVCKSMTATTTEDWIMR